MRRPPMPEALPSPKLLLLIGALAIAAGAAARRSAPSAGAAAGRTAPSSGSAAAERAPPTRMNGIAESYVKLVLAVGQHDADYVDAFYGPAEWKRAAAAA